MRNTKEEYRLALIERQILEAEERMHKLMSSIRNFGEGQINTDHPKILMEGMQLESLYTSRQFILESWREKHTPVLLP